MRFRGSFSAITHLHLCSMLCAFRRAIPSKKLPADSILPFRNNITIILPWRYGVFQQRQIYAVGLLPASRTSVPSLSGSANHGIPEENRRHAPVRQGEPGQLQGQVPGRSAL